MTAAVRAAVRSMDDVKGGAPGRRAAARQPEDQEVRQGRCVCLCCAWGARGRGGLAVDGMGWAAAGPRDHGRGARA